VDLVLARDGEFAVVDHKTGKKFNEADPLQLAVYREYVRRECGASRCLAYFDAYRFVNNLGRIRKPAFLRTEVKGRALGWAKAKGRLAKAHKAMARIAEGGRVSADGECFACPYREECPERSGGFAWY
jgi:RecB family exonuclease